MGAGLAEGGAGPGERGALPSQHSSVSGSYLTSSQKRKLRLRERKGQAEGDWAGPWWRGSLPPGLSPSPHSGVEKIPPDWPNLGAVHKDLL